LPLSELYTLSLHDALPILAPLTDSNPDIQRLREEYSRRADVAGSDDRYSNSNPAYQWMLVTRQQAIKEFLECFGVSDLSKLRIRSEEHTSELQSRENLVCR